MRPLQWPPHAITGARREVENVVEVHAESVVPLKCLAVEVAVRRERGVDDCSVALRGANGAEAAVEDKERAAPVRDGAGGVAGHPYAGLAVEPRFDFGAVDQELVVLVIDIDFDVVVCVQLGVPWARLSGAEPLPPPLKRVDEALRLAPQPHGYEDVHVPAPHVGPFLVETACDLARRPRAHVHDFLSNGA